MKIVLLAVMLIVLNCAVFAQGFEISGLQDNYKGTIGETIKAPVRFKNTSEKALTLVIRKISGQIGSTQRNYICVDGNCLDQRVEDYLVKLDAGQTFGTFQIVLDAGLVSGESVVRYQVYNRINPGQTTEFDLNFNVEERPEKENIYSSRFVTLHDVYPNPVVDQAVVDYKILNERVKAKLVVHNLLGNVVGEYSLPSLENFVRVKTDELTAGIYFYTLYVDNESVMTRKLIVRK
ncbi:MAG TPA: T9SS type A sorting domain-containing protein [Chryseolinea sp.]|nr:T9SS type A sorting domain-containing protein [Chryseolinea sp.]